MNTPNTSHQELSEVQAIMDAGCDPIFVSVVVTIFDTRKNPRNPQKARRVQTFIATPESLAALPSLLNSMVRGAGEDAQRELNKFLALLAQPEPPATEPPSKPTPVPAAEYLMPTPLPLLSDPPGAALSGPP